MKTHTKTRIIVKLSLLVLTGFLICKYGDFGFIKHRIQNMKFNLETSNKNGANKVERLFKPSYVPAVPGPSVHLITFITQGQQPSWDVKKNEEIVYLPQPKKDNHITHYKRSDILDLLTIMKNISTNVPHKYSNHNISYLIQGKAALSPAIMKMLKHWINITKGSPQMSLPIKAILSHLGILLHKKDAERPWVLTCDACFKNEFKTILDPTHACAGNNEIDIVAIVTSVPQSAKTRMVIRETWGSWTKNNTSNFRLIFLFGIGWPAAVSNLLAKENDKYGDILQEDYHDSYYNLTQKVISGFKWVLRSCSRAKFILRSAEDGFVNLPEVLYHLQLHGNHSRFQDYQIGKCFVKFKPHRWPDYKGYLSTDEYADDVFPPYALGTSFIMSNKLTQRIVEKSQDINYIPIEDSYFGLVLREIGSGCQHVKPFTPASDGVVNKRKKRKFQWIQNKRRKKVQIL